MKRILGRFVLEREIGAGGMSTVYLGADEVLGRAVAIKILKSGFTESDIGVRFRQEGRTAARLSHPNIVQVYDAGEDVLEGEKIFYIIMEHISGGDLRDLIRGRGTLSREEVSNLSGVAAGLAHAHERGVIHRDVKPHNILLDRNGNPKLADFGIARALDATQATRTGTYVGTARYSSPEQLQGKAVTTKSDVYSLGAMLYEAVVGEPPFSGTPIEIASQHVSKPPPPPSGFLPVDEELENLILTCLAKDPEDRPTAAQARDRLSGAAPETPKVPEAPKAGGGPAPAQDPVSATAPATAPATASATGRAAVRGASAAGGRNGLSRRTPLLVALVGVLALAVGLGIFALAGGEGSRVQAPAETTREPARSSAASPGQTTVGAPQDTEARPTIPQPVAPAPGETESQPEGVSREQAAAQAVEDVYRLAASGEYERSYSFLSPAFRQEQASTQAEWSNQFDTLQSISFLEGPNAEVSGDAARVTGVTLAEHTDRTERNTVTWTLIRDGGQWKLNDLNMSQQELV